MDQCFLFTQDLKEDACLSLKLSSKGELLAPPALRPFDEIKLLQNESHTLVVETSSSATFISLELPWLADRKARIAIPYALEDKLAQPIDELHFAFDKAHYHNHHYLVTIINKQRMHYLMHFLEEQDIEFDAITLDWFALESEELAYSQTLLLVNTGDYKGCLSDSLALEYIRNHPLNSVILFKDSPALDISTELKYEESSHEWIAKRLLHSRPLNLCQGEMQHGNASDWIKKGYLICGALFLFWLLSMIVVNAISLYFINQNTAKIDQQIAQIYREFFPDAKQIISPKFRIQQLLKSNASDNQSRFWFLLNQFARGMKNNKITVEQLLYQNNTLSVTLISTDFASLEALANQLKALQLKVKQTQASNQNQKVVATLELT